MFVSLLAAVVLLLQGQPSYRVVKQGGVLIREDRGVFAAPPGGTLRVSVPGELTVRGVAGASPAVAYRLRSRVPGRDAGLVAGQRVSVREAGGVVHVSFLSRPGAESIVELSIPESVLNLSVQARDGAVTVSDVAANVTVHVGSGPVSLDQVAGAVSVETGGGAVQLGQIYGPVVCRSGGGSISVRKAQSSCRLSTAGGEVTVEEAHGPLRAETAGGNIQVWRALSTVDAISSAGLVVVNQAAGRVLARVNQGGIHIGNAVGADCRAQQGTIRLDTVRGALQAATGRGAILAGVDGALEDSRLFNGEGDITVFLPSNLRATVQAEARAAGVMGAVVTDLHQLIAQNWIWLLRPPAHLAASLNGGGPRLVVSTTGGVIYLKKQKTE